MAAAWGCRQIEFVADRQGVESEHSAYLAVVPYFAAEAACTLGRKHFAVRSSFVAATASAFAVVAASTSAAVAFAFAASTSSVVAAALACASERSNPQAVAVVVVSRRLGLLRKQS